MRSPKSAAESADLRSGMISPASARGVERDDAGRRRVFVVRKETVVPSLPSSRTARLRRISLCHRTVDGEFLTKIAFQARCRGLASMTS